MKILHSAILLACALALSGCASHERRAAGREGIMAPRRSWADWENEHYQDWWHSVMD